jgi:hypothetical protein
MIWFFAINLIATVFVYMRFHTQVATKILKKGGNVNALIPLLITISWIIFYYLNQ